MKTKLILGGLIALTNLNYAQTVWNGSNTSGNAYRTGNIGLGNGNVTSPIFAIDMKTSVPEDGIRIEQTNSGQCGLHLNNSSTGGRKWSVYSNGSGNSEGAGNFSINDNTLFVPRFLIEGGTGNVGIGTTAPAAKLHVVGTTLGIKVNAGSNSGDIGVQGNGYYGVDGNGGLVGTRGSCFTPSGAFNQGVRGNASSGVSNVAGYFQAGGGASGVVSYGVYSEVAPGTLGLGGTNYGIYASVSGNNNLGAGPNYAGYFNGDVVTAGGSYFYSDGRIKKDITSINSSLSIIKQLNPVNYNFEIEGNKNLALPTEKQYGFISQEVQKILPEFTKTLIHPATLDESGREISPKKEVLGLNYNGFIAILTKGIQEQQVNIESLEKQLAEQKTLIDDLNQKLSGTTGINSVNGNETGFQTSQNEPNPFTHETVIKYIIPQTIGNASMAVYDLSGKQIANFLITEKGSASLTITSEKLAAGIYIYSIIADGKIVDSKRMVVSEK